jgi:hypothetical protein
MPRGLGKVSAVQPVVLGPDMPEMFYRGDGRIDRLRGTSGHQDRPGGCVASVTARFGTEAERRPPHHDGQIRGLLQFHDQDPGADRMRRSDRARHAVTRRHRHPAGQGRQGPQVLAAAHPVSSSAPTSRLKPRYTAAPGSASTTIQTI